MKEKLNLLMIIFLIIMPNITYAKIYNCSVKGKIIFQSKPCPDKPEKKFLSKNTSNFGFDNWKFGMSLLSVKQAARARQLPMSPGTTIFLSRYNEKVLNSQPNKRSYTYKTKILGKQTSVTLFFTKVTKKLYKIKATFTVVRLKPEEKKYFYKSLFEKLSNKYGKPKDIRKESTGSFLTDFIVKDTSMLKSQILWKPSKTKVVSLGYNKNYHTNSSFKLTYKDISLSLQNKKEMTYELRQRTNSEIFRDSEKL